MSVLKFACYFLAEKPSFLVVNISPDAYVKELLNAIRVQIELEFKGQHFNDLYFFKASLFFI